MTRILVIGGAGYIGSHCCKALAEAGYEPVVYDNFSAGHAEFVRWGAHFAGDIRDQARLDEVLAEVRPAGVMHFAALASVGDSVGDPGTYYDVNVVGTLRLLTAMRTAGVDKLVFSSTCAVYGEPDIVPITEDTACRPVNPYGATKLICERMMDDFSVAHGLRSVRLRYFNACGADPEGSIGEWHDPETHLIPLVLDAALGRRGPVKIFGTDYPTADGTAVRDYIHVTDLASAHLAALRYLLNGGSTAAVNIGTGSGVSVANVIRAAEIVTDRPVPRQDAPRRAGDPPQLVADPSKAEQLLGWRAQITDLVQTIGDAWRWQKGRNA